MKRNGKLYSMMRFFSFVAVFCFALSLGTTVYATDAAQSQAVRDARQGILQINLVYVDQTGHKHVIETGSGFLIGASSGATTVITNNHVVTLDAEEVAQCSALYGVDFSNLNNINMQIQIVVKRDIVVNATYRTGSEKTDFAILELSEPIYDKKPLKIADSDHVKETAAIYALGFPWTASVVQDDQVYTSQDVRITGGIVSKFQTVENIQYILHDASLGYGNSGGPLLDANGNVIGVNTMFAGDGANNYYYSLAINEVSDVLNSFGIAYEKAGDGAEPQPEPNPEPQPEPNPEPQPDPEPQPEPNPDPQPSPNPQPEPAEKDNSIMIVAIVAVAAVLLIVIILVVVISNSKKKKKPVMGGGNAPVYGGGAPVPPFNPAQQGGRAPQPMPPQPPFPTGMDSGAGETSVLGVGAGETSVLGGGAGMQPAATLIRRKTGESVSIVKPSFVIGKERSRVDFCVPDNNNISRAHANIICRGGVYFIVDNNSTNFTYINGNKVMPKMETRLNSGDKIRLADEEFEFRL